MPRRKKTLDEMPSLLDITAKLRSGACVPALREAVKSWKAGGRKGMTDTTGVLLSYWFEADHKLKTGRPFRYHDSQREAARRRLFLSLSHGNTSMPCGSRMKLQRITPRLSCSSLRT